MRPPMFSVVTTGNIAQQYLHHARMFRQAASQLPDYSNGEQYWPKYALLTHAIELSLKAFVRGPDGQAPSKEPKQHDLVGWYRLAVEGGLEDDPRVADNIEVLNQLHNRHYTRYPQNRPALVPDASVIADDTVDHLIFTITEFINPR